MTRPKLKAAVVGATGLVGAELVEMLGGRLPLDRLRLFSSMNTAGEKLEFMGQETLVEPMSADYYQDADLIFFTAPAMVSRDLAEDAARAGAVVIDPSPTFRLEPEVPLVVPEVNRQALDALDRDHRLVASPAAQTVAAALVAAPLHQRFGLVRMNATVTHGSTSSGRAAFEEHQFQTVDVFNQSELKVERFPRQTAFNVFPRVGEFEGADTTAERELMDELPRLLGASLPMAVTAVQVPIFCGLGLSLSLEFGGRVEAAAAREVLAEAPSVRVIDEPEAEAYPDTLLAMGHEQVTAGRIRRDPAREQGLLLWVSADNLRKGSALNMVHIAQALLENWPE